MAKIPRGLQEHIRAPLVSLLNDISTVNNGAGQPVVDDLTELRSKLIAARADIVDLRSKFATLRTLVDELKTKLSAHTHGGVTVGEGTSAAAQTISASSSALAAASATADPAALTATAGAAEVLTTEVE